jgi:hypothetical protein
MLCASESLANPVYDPLQVPLSYQINEDPHSVPNPLAGKMFMTSTQARYLKEQTSDIPNIETPGKMEKFHAAYNNDSVEPKKPSQFDVLHSGNRLSYIQIRESESSESESESDAPGDNVTVLWRVEPDLGEDDAQVVPREFDTANGKKFHGWTNPLGWTDSGDDDEKVLPQLKSKIRYDESGYPTPADNGLDDDQVVNLLQTKQKISTSQKYDKSEGPTKVDFGDADYNVLPREFDIANGKKFHGWTNPLGWTDDGEDDEGVL